MDAAAARVTPIDSGEPGVSVVLLDLDGVVRHFDSSSLAEVEQRHGLASGALMAAAFAPDLIESVTTGRISHAMWTDAIGAAVGSRLAAVEWLADRGSIDVDVLDLVDELRAGGVTVAILTNGTDAVAAELAQAGVDRRVDAVFNSADIGFAKPDIRAFEHVCRELEVAPAEVFFTDDSEGKLTGARELGMHVEHFVGVAKLRASLQALGLPDRSGTVL